MAIEKETEAEIVRLFHAEGWKQATIAAQLSIHYSTVRRVLDRSGLMPKEFSARRSMVDKYIPFIKETLEKYPKLNASRLHYMVKMRGYEGGVDHFRHIIARYRPNPAPEAYLRLTTLPGEQGQVDWGHFGKINIGRAERRLLAFVMVLSWSRHIFLRFYLGDGTGNFLRGHVEAFEHFQAVPREILYDNLKSAVLSRIGSAIYFNPEILALASHYRFAAKPVAIARGNEKGRVERAIRYIRDSFFPARRWQDLDDLNQQAIEWCKQEARERRCPQDKSLTVAEAFEKEKPFLLAQPGAPYPVYDRIPVRVGKTPYVRFDLNDYSVPHQYVRKQLLVEATLKEVRVMDGLTIAAKHERSFDKDKQIEEKEHVEGLVAVKREASKHRGMNRLHHVAPSSGEFFKQAAQRGCNMGRLTQFLTRLLDLYGAVEFEAALSEVLAAGAIHSSAVEQALERRRYARKQAPPVPLKFASHIDEFNVVPKSLAMYDTLLKGEEVDNA
jgi:transposase